MAIKKSDGFSNGKNCVIEEGGGGVITKLVPELRMQGSSAAGRDLPADGWMTPKIKCIAGFGYISL